MSADPANGEPLLMKAFKRRNDADAPLISIKKTKISRDFLPHARSMIIHEACAHEMTLMKDALKNPGESLKFRKQAIREVGRDAESVDLVGKYAKHKTDKTNTGRRLLWCRPKNYVQVAPKRKNRSVHANEEAKRTTNRIRFRREATDRGLHERKKWTKRKISDKEASS